jgi:hypothetical protein
LRATRHRHTYPKGTAMIHPADIDRFARNIIAAELAKDPDRLPRDVVLDIVRTTDLDLQDCATIARIAAGEASGPPRSPRPIVDAVDVIVATFDRLNSDPRKYLTGGTPETDRRIAAHQILADLGEAGWRVS